MSNATCQKIELRLSLSEVEMLIGLPSIVIILDWFTLLAAAIIHGMIESAPWAGTSVYVAFLGEQKWKKQGNRNESGVVPQKTFVFRYFGKFNVFIYAGVVRLVN